MKAEAAEAQTGPRSTLGTGASAETEAAPAAGQRAHDKAAADAPAAAAVPAAEEEADGESSGEEWDEAEEGEGGDGQAQPWWAVEGALDASAGTIFLARRCFSFRHRVSAPRDTRGGEGEEPRGGGDGSPSEAAAERGRDPSGRSGVGSGALRKNLPLFGRAPLESAGSGSTRGDGSHSARAWAAVFGRSRTFGSGPVVSPGGLQRQGSASGRGAVQELTSGQVMRSLRSVAASSSRRGARSLPRFSSFRTRHGRRALSADPFLWSMRDRVAAIEGGRRLMDDEKLWRARAAVLAALRGESERSERSRGGRKRSVDSAQSQLSALGRSSKPPSRGASGLASAASTPLPGSSAPGAWQGAPAKAGEARSVAGTAATAAQSRASGGARSSRRSGAAAATPGSASPEAKSQGSALARLCGCFGGTAAEAPPSPEPADPARGRV